MKPDSGNLAVWAVTPGGMELALKLAAAFPGTALHLSRNLPACPDTCYIFNRLKDSVQERFSLFQGHVFIMSTGIVVRVISPCIRSKMLDPAVVVMDEEGQYAISLLSGHVGGANRLASEIARKLHVTPVITTATDIRQIPSIDVIAVDHGLLIENPAAIKSISMSLLNQLPVCLHDPYHCLDNVPDLQMMTPADVSCSEITTGDAPAVVVDDRLLNLPPRCLVLRPGTLIAGVGCNRNTHADEILEFLAATLLRFNLSLHSLKCIATIDIKSDEAGLLETAKYLQIPIRFFSREELASVESLPCPSEIVMKHIGVPSVCEAAAVLASSQGALIVPKQIGLNVTLSIARTNFLSSD